VATYGRIGVATEGWGHTSYNRRKGEWGQVTGAGFTMTPSGAESSRADGGTQRLAKVIAQDILQRIQDALRELGDPYFIRAGVDSWRVKASASLARKAAQHGWARDQAISKAQDVLGFRVVCHNLQDVGRVASLLMDSLGQAGLKPQRKDYVTNPKKDGYRAVHLTFRYPAKLAALQAEVGCEIQIRSLLQNSWAQLSRADLYAPSEEVPSTILKKMRLLSDQLAKADAIADSIRTQFARPRKGRKPTSETPISGSALAFIYRQRYGGDPPEYLVQWVLREYQGTEVRTDGLDSTLRDEVFQEKLREAYGDRVKWDADKDQLFRWSVHSLVHGQESAIRHARRDGKEEWGEIVRIALLEDGDSDFESLASGLGGLRHCDRCGATIVDPEDLADAVVSHYKLRGKRADNARDRLITAVQSSGVEVGAWDNSRLCGYCDHVMSKDD